ncbi:hypothetical protein B0H15DRAFT_949945 [Mycena belliarum]|uniref:Bacteriophage T5 Orf172 DNA-binding domain-containing protein n=1 Tax=Mycena belliarum TaxID=1033014 RepID=A0AAD6U7P4_9AGAR|nr:hypothetical protein B0H15DRAFT_949945 [Mycena belliae]
MPQVEALLKLGPASAYQNDGPGVLYYPVRVAPGYQAAVEIKAGHTKNFHRRQHQYKKCKKGQDLRFVAYCETPYRMFAERLIHLRLRALGAHVDPYPCPGCGKEHREFFSLGIIGGFPEFEAVVCWAVTQAGGAYIRQNFLVES